MSIDHLADAMNTIKVHEMTGQRECIVPGTKFVGRVLEILKKKGYIGDYSLIEDGVRKYYHVKLIGRINNCGVIKPRYAVKRTEIVEYEEQYIPAVGVGILIISTSKGLMTNQEIEKERVGGRLIAYVY